MNNLKLNFPFNFGRHSKQYSETHGKRQPGASLLLPNVSVSASQRFSVSPNSNDSTTQPLENPHRVRHHHRHSRGHDCDWRSPAPRGQTQIARSDSGRASADPLKELHLETLRQP